MGYLEALEPVDGRRCFRLNSPVDGAEVHRFSVDTAADVEAKVARARAVQPAWAATPV